MQKTASVPDVLTRAFNQAKQEHPDAPTEQQRAFANAVTYAVTGMLPLNGGPSMREHWCSWVINEAGGSGTFTYEKAVDVCTEPCFGPMTRQIANMLVIETCFDDSADDRKKAFELNKKV